jgi:hypothetical protein
MVKGKAGRPPQGDKKLVQRAVTSDPEIEEFLRKNPGVNASDVFRRAVHSMMPRDIDSIRLSKLAEEIADMRVSLSIKEAEYNSLKRRVEEREKLQLDIRLEQDCHAWYLRSLVQSGVFRIMVSEAVDPVSFVEDEIRSGSIKPGEISINDGTARLTDKASIQTRKRLRRFLTDRRNVLVPIPRREWVVPILDTLRSGYGISLEFEAFEKEFLLNQSMGDLPLDYFRRFKPIIIQERLKSEIKSRMEPSYRTISLETGGRN